MSLLFGLAVGLAAAMAIIWLPAYPEPDRHPHMRAMDRLATPERAELEDEFPHGRCWCGAPRDARGVCVDGPYCARDSWDHVR